MRLISSPFNPPTHHTPPLAMEMQLGEQAIRAMVAKFQGRILPPDHKARCHIIWLLWTLGCCLVVVGVGLSVCCSLPSLLFARSLLL